MRKIPENRDYKIIVVYKDSYLIPGYDPGESSYRSYYDAIKGFLTEEEFLKWYKDNQMGDSYSKLDILAIYRTEKIETETTITVKVK